MRKHLLIAGFLGLASMLVGATGAQAQNSYFYGWYYPAEHRFHSNELNTNVVDYSTITPMWNATHDPRGAAYPIVPTSTMLFSGTQNQAPAPLPAQVRVIVPENAVVYFGQHRTNSTGTQRVYLTPAMRPGTYEYHVKVSTNQAGREVAQERTVSIRPGQTAVVDFTESLASR